MAKLPLTSGLDALGLGEVSPRPPVSPRVTRPQPKAQLADDRLRGIDAARGAAMAFVCLSHFGLEYFRPFGGATAQVTMYRIGMVASPTFMLISGMMLGLLYGSRREEFGRLS